MMPEGCDSVTMQEDCEVAGDRVVIPTGLRAGSNRRRRGEDIAAGRQVLSRGSWLRPQDVGLAASLGSTTLCVYRRLRVALFSTGDEIREPGAPIGAGQAYDANRFALGALIEGLGAAVDDLGIVPDRPEALRALLAQAAGDHDLIIGSGGVSVGEEDHVRDVIRALGSLHFWRLAIKPGRPLALGQVAGTPFVALPGNPVAVMVTFFRFVRPLALRLAGAKDVDPRLFPVTADFAYRKKPGRREWLRVRLAADPGGGWLARPFPRDGAGILSSLVESDGLLELPEELTELAPGGRVDFLPFSEVSR
jgi:molybdopterin molybdotransferase